MNARNILQQHVSRIAPLTEAEFDRFYAHFTEQSFKKGQALITEHARVDCEYFVVSGCLKSFYINDELKMFILSFAMKTWWISDYNALYNNTPATLHVDCITDATVLCLTSESREQLCKELHAAEYFFRWRTNRGYVSLQRRLLSFMNNDARKRYEALLAQYPELYNLVPKHLIAAYLGVSRETLSRLYHPKSGS